MANAGFTLLMALYSLTLMLALLVGSPYWVFRMLTSGRYRAGLAGRLGRVPPELRAAVSGKRVIWLHAVSVGEVLAATRLVQELEERLNGMEVGPTSSGTGSWLIVVSTTTATGQALAKERFGAERVFWYPLDFAWAVRNYLRVLQPRILVLMESELWPRMLHECQSRRIPVAVVNARVSDRSFARALKAGALWRTVLRGVTVFLAQTAEDARRLQTLGAKTVQATGNLKYDIRTPSERKAVEAIRAMAAGRPVIVAGSTVRTDDGGGEEKMVLEAWRDHVAPRLRTLLVIAPRHPERFEHTASLLSGCNFVRASTLTDPSMEGTADILLLDTVGDLAAVYATATVAFLGGSLVPRGGHNPLEAARFAVPVISGPSTTNFREVYAGLTEAGGALVLSDVTELGATLVHLLQNPGKAKAMGERARAVYERQQGATTRTVSALLQVIAKGLPE